MTVPLVRNGDYTATGFEAVVRKALPSNYKKKRQSDFSVDGAMDYLELLTGSRKETAFEYIRNAPEEVETPVRTRFDDRYGRSEKQTWPLMGSPQTTTSFQNRQTAHRRVRFWGGLVFAIVAILCFGDLHLADGISS